MVVSVIEESGLTVRAQRFQYELITLTRIQVHPARLISLTKIRDFTTQQPEYCIYRGLIRPKEGKATTCF